MSLSGRQLRDAFRAAQRSGWEIEMPTEAARAGIDGLVNPGD